MVIIEVVMYQTYQLHIQYTRAEVRNYVQFSSDLQNTRC